MLSELFLFSAFTLSRYLLLYLLIETFVLCLLHCVSVDIQSNEFALLSGCCILKRLMMLNSLYKHVNNNSNTSVHTLKHKGFIKAKAMNSHTVCWQGHWVPGNVNHPLVTNEIQVNTPFVCMEIRLTDAFMNFAALTQDSRNYIQVTQGHSPPVLVFFSSSAVYFGIW